MVQKVTLEIDFQDTDVPIYTSFENIEEGYVVLYGINKKRVASNILDIFKGVKNIFGVISDRTGREIRYAPLIGRRGMEAFNKMLEMEEDSYIWLFGKVARHKKDPTDKLIFVQDCGKKEEFKSPYLLDELNL